MFNRNHRWKPSGLLLGRFLIIDLISLINIGLFRFPISSSIRFGNLCSFPWNVGSSTKLLSLLVQGFLLFLCPFHAYRLCNNVSYFIINTVISVFYFLIKLVRQWSGLLVFFLNRNQLLFYCFFLLLSVFYFIKSFSYLYYFHSSPYNEFNFLFLL